MIFPNFYEVTLVVDKPQVVTACIDRKKFQMLFEQNVASNVT